jgi:hypothetical protein
VWPKDLESSKKEILEYMGRYLEDFSRLITAPVSLKTLLANPERAIPALSYMLAIYEEEHNNAKPFDVRRLPLPRRFTLSPEPGIHWCFITIDTSCLSIFTQITRLKGYYAQLEMFEKVFKLDKIKQKRY